MADDASDLRAEVAALKERLARLEERLDRMGTRRGERPAQPPDAALPRPRREEAEVVFEQAPVARPASQPAPRPPRDLETLLGATWLPRLGITVLVLGAAFFIAYTIEKEWISLTGQILLGAVGGAALAAVGEWLRRRHGYGTIPGILVAGGVVITYFAVFAAHHFEAYRAATGVGLLTDLVLLGVVAAAGVGLALRHDRPTLVGMAYVLAYLTALLSNEVELLSLGYVTIIGVSLTTLVWWRGWVHVAAPAAAATWLVLSGLRAELTGFEWPFAAAVVLLGALFWLAAERTARVKADLGAATAFLASAGASLLLWWNAWRVDEALSDHVVLGLAVLHAAAALLLPRPGLKGAAGVAAAILAFVWAPLYLDMYAVTFTWAAIAAAFAALGFRTGTVWARYVAYAAAAILFVRVLFFDPNEWMDDAATLGALSTVAATAALAAVYWFAAAHEGPRAAGDGLRPSDGALVAAALAPLGALAVLLVGYAISVAWALEGVALVVAGFTLDRREVRLTGAGLLVLVVGRVLVVDLEGLDTGWRIVVFLVVGALLLAASLLFVRARRAEPS